MIIVYYNSQPNEAEEPLSPQSAAFLANINAYNNNYEQFDSLTFSVQGHSDQEKNKQMFNTLRELRTGSAWSKTYVLYAYDNGEKVLLEYVDKNEKPKRYYLYNMIVVPKDYHDLFDSELYSVK